MILGLNLKEAIEIAEVLGLPGQSDPEAAIEADAAAIREALDLACVVIHPRRAAAAATAIESARFAGPFVKHPMISTGAGDHFNAGFCLGRILGLDLRREPLRRGLDQRLLRPHRAESDGQAVVRIHRAVATARG